jgi:hypothetical protein
MAIQSISSQIMGSQRMYCFWQSKKFHLKEKVKKKSGWGSIVSRPPVVVLQKSFSRVLLSIDYVQYILSTPPYHIFQIYQNVHKGVKKKGAIQTKTIKTWLWKIKVTGLKHTMCPFVQPMFTGEPQFGLRSHLLSLNQGCWS